MSSICCSSRLDCCYAFQMPNFWIAAVFLLSNLYKEISLCISASIDIDDDDYDHSCVRYYLMLILKIVCSVLSLYVFISHTAVVPEMLKSIFCRCFVSFNSIVYSTV